MSYRLITTKITEDNKNRLNLTKSAKNNQNSKKMKKLRLSLTGQWFEMTEKGIKREDYREITPYWCARLCLCYGKKHSKRMWKTLLYVCNNDPVLLMSKEFVTFCDFDQNEMTKGYPKNTDAERIINLDHLGIKIGYGKEEWGAEPNKLYFVIKHGAEINKHFCNCEYPAKMKGVNQCYRCKKPFKDLK